MLANIKGHSLDGRTHRRVDERRAHRRRLHAGLVEQHQFVGECLHEAVGSELAGDVSRLAGNGDITAY